MLPFNGTRVGTVAALDAARYTDLDSERTDRAGEERTTIAPMVAEAIKTRSFSR